MLEQKQQKHEIERLRIVILGYNDFTISIINKFVEESSSISIVCNLRKIPEIHRKKFLNKNNINLHQMSNSLTNDFENATFYLASYEAFFSTGGKKTISGNPVIN